jgi:GDP-D-mannose 3',5'-epimerase
MKTALVLGGTGFIGTNMVKRLKREGYFVRAVDIKAPEFEPSEADELLIYDLRDPRNVESVMRLEYFSAGLPEMTLRNPAPYTYTATAYANRIPFDEVYNFACVMGGAGFVFTGKHDAEIMHDSVLINANVAYYANHYKARNVFFSSSACGYPQQIQEDVNNPGLKESDAWPANPDSMYGLEKLFSERMYLAYAKNHGLNIRIARFHNIYGPLGTYKGGKEKAPAAICRKVIESTDKIEIWGDGEQTRSFLYIDDCIDAVRLLMESDFKEPINIGSEEMVSINELAKLAMFIGNKDLEIKHIEGPTGVRGRNSNNELIEKVLGWKPKFSLAEGLANTYHWIYEMVKKKSTPA